MVRGELGVSEKKPVPSPSHHPVELIKLNCALAERDTLVQAAFPSSTVSITVRSRCLPVLRTLPAIEHFAPWLE